MERKLRYCAVCGTAYRFCPKCNEDKDKPLYHYTFCSENCKNIYWITSEFENNSMTSDVAYELLSEQDLCGFENFGLSYKNSINKINDSCSEKLSNENESVQEFISEQVLEEDVLDCEIIEVKNKSPKRTKKNVE